MSNSETNVMANEPSASPDASNQVAAATDVKTPFPTVEELVKDNSRDELLARATELGIQFESDDPKVLVKKVIASAIVDKLTETSIGSATMTIGSSEEIGPVVTTGDSVIDDPSAESIPSSEAADAVIDEPSAEPEPLQGLGLQGVEDLEAGNDPTDQGDPSLRHSPGSIESVMAELASSDAEPAHGYNSHSPNVKLTGPQAAINTKLWHIINRQGGNLRKPGDVYGWLLDSIAASLKSCRDEIVRDDS